MDIEHFENQEHEWDSNLKVTDGVEQPVQVNPQAMERMMRNRQKLMPLELTSGGRILIPIWRQTPIRNASFSAFSISLVITAAMNSTG